jgi:hypothetical protein
MEQTQLIKRLYDMSWDDIESLIPYEETIHTSLYKLDMAARTRHIIHAIQLEDMWQALDEESKSFKLYLSMRLSPMTLQSCFALNHDLNGLEWNFVFPKYDDIPTDIKPRCFGEYLATSTNVQIIDIESYDIELACEFLDRAYDFTPFKNKPSIPPK